MAEHVHHPHIQKITWRSMVFPVSAILLLHALGLITLLVGLSTSTATAGALTLTAGLTAYMLGLRHAFDADHIAAIDNATRKLVGDGHRPTSIGLYFALGHSTIVFIVAAAVITGLHGVADAITDENSALRTVGSQIGSLVAGSFLLLIAALNILALLRSRGPQGALSRIYAPLTRTLDSQWKMYPLGLLFGLGFDTAASIALIIVSAAAALSGGGVLVALSLPLLFTAAMALGDTLDGILMNHAYTWATHHPERRKHYNRTVTWTSIVAALTIGTPILLASIADLANLNGPFWDLVRSFDAGQAGILLAALLVTIWLTSVIAWRIRNRDDKPQTS